MKAEFYGMTLGEFARSFGRVTNRPIVDNTGITGLFDINLEFAVEPDYAHIPTWGRSAREPSFASRFRSTSAP